MILKFNTSIPHETGNLTAWKKYRNDYMVPLNKMFQESQGTEFKRVRDELQLKFDVITEWDPWGICEICGRPQGQGKKHKKGHCRLKISSQIKNVCIE